MGRFLRVGVIASTSPAGGRKGYTTILLKSDKYSNDNGREIEFIEVGVPKIITVGDVLKIDSANYDTKRFYNASERWEYVQDPVIVSAEGIGTDPVFSENSVNIASALRTTAEKDSMKFDDILPQGVANGQFALGKWARNHPHINNVYDWNKLHLGVWDMYGQFSDMTSAVQQARRLGVIHFKRGWDWLSEGATDISQTKFQTVSSFTTGPFVWGCDTMSWFRNHTNDDFRKQKGLVVFVNEDNSTLWWGNWNDNGYYDISGTQNFNGDAKKWSMLKEYAPFVNMADNQVIAVKKVNITRDEFVSRNGTFNMGAFQDLYPDDEIQEVKYNQRQALTYYTNNYWWDIRSDKTFRGDPTYNVKEVDFFKDSMTLGRQMVEQGR